MSDEVPATTDDAPLTEDEEEFGQSINAETDFPLLPVTKHVGDLVGHERMIGNGP